MLLRGLGLLRRRLRLQRHDAPIMGPDREMPTFALIAVAWPSNIFAAAALCSTRAEFCWVISSIWFKALLICSIPPDCSRLAEAISEMIPATSLIDCTTSLSVVPALLTSSTPSCTWLLLLVMRSLMSLAACDDRCARLRTSAATTANPAAGLAGARRFYGRVERQEVGLPRDLVDHDDDVGNLARRRFDPGHGVDGGRHDLTTAVGDLGRYGSGLARLPGIFGIFLHG